MDTSEIIPLILKYFNFEQLCRAERINSNFKYSVELELQTLKFIDFGKVFASQPLYELVATKIINYCFNLRSLRNLASLLTFMHLPSFPELLHVLSKLEHVEIGPWFRKAFNEKDIFAFIEKACYLQELWIDMKNFNAICDRDLFTRLKNILIGHQNLKSLEICTGGYLLNFPAFKNLSRLDIDFRREIGNDQFGTLCSILSDNTKLEALSLSNIVPNDLFVEKLKALQHLKTLSLSVGRKRSDNSNSVTIKSMNNLCFNHLEQLYICCHEVRKYRDFILSLVTSGTVLKWYHLTFHESDLNFWQDLFKNLQSWELIKCFHVDGDSSYEEQIFICHQMTRMINLKHFHGHMGMEAEHAQIIATMKSIKFMDLSACLYSHNRILRILCCKSLQGLELRPNFCCANNFSNLIMDASIDCSNLRYLSLGKFTKENIRALPTKVPNLQFLRFSGYLHELDKDVAFAVENLPNLRFLFVDEYVFTSLLTLDAIKRRCQQGKLFIHYNYTFYFDISLREEWREICEAICTPTKFGFTDMIIP